MRLIDADEIRWTNLEDGFGRIKECIAFATDIDAMQAVEVVRCKDCKWYEMGEEETYCRELGIFNTDYTSYCSYAKRKEE